MREVERRENRLFHFAGNASPQQASGDLGIHGASCVRSVQAAVRAAGSRAARFVLDGIMEQMRQIDDVVAEYSTPADMAAGAVLPVGWDYEALVRTAARNRAEAERYWEGLRSEGGWRKRGGVQATLERGTVADIHSDWVVEATGKGMARWWRP